jgi:glycosyltransferase involved in cell wall biosynthesis
MPRVALLRSRFPDVRLEKEARALAKGGFQTEIITWDRKRGAPSAKREPVTDVKALELAAPPSSVLVILLLPVWMCYAFTRLVRGKADTVHAADFDACLPAFLAAKITNVPMVYDIYDLYAETMAFPFLKKCLRRFISRLDSRLMDQASEIILPDRSRLKQIGERFAGKTVYVYNSPEESQEEQDLNLAAHEHDGFSLFFGGEVTPDRCLHQVMEAVTGLPDISLKIVGPAGAAYGAKLRDLALKASNVDLQLSWHQPDYVMKCVRESDALFAIYDPIVPNNRFSSPNKLFEAMMCGKPIIVNAGTSMDLTVKEEDCGIVIDKISPEAIREAILRLKRDAGLRKRLGGNGRRAYDQKYGWSIMERRLIELHSRLAK